MKKNLKAYLSITSFILGGLIYTLGGIRAVFYLTDKYNPSGEFFQFIVTFLSVLLLPLWLIGLIYNIFSKD